MGLVRCEVDQGCFFHWDGADLLVVVIHVDDCTVGAARASQIDEFKKELKKHVEITDLGNVNWLLGIQIQQDHKRKVISLW